MSDAIYRECDRYVSRQRLESMLECEQRLNRQRLAEQRGENSCFFSFADTVSARNYLGTNESHAWMGIRFQAAPGAQDSVIVIHVRMLDDNNPDQQEALGIIGVNLVHGAYSYHTDTNLLLETFADGLSAGRIEICLEDFVSRAEVISTTGCVVMISDFQEYHRLAAYLSRYTDRSIGLAMGLAGLESLFDEKYYEDLDGGLLESFGRLFKELVKLLVYPRKDAAHEYLDIHSPEVLQMIATGRGEWTAMVPDCVAKITKTQRLFGYAG